MPVFQRQLYERLRRRAAQSYSQRMGTSDLLRQLKALTPRERQKVFKAILALEQEESSRFPVKTKPVKWPDVEARARLIFGKRVLPNLVLLEREEEAL
jgi:hypothetical protein